MRTILCKTSAFAKFVQRYMATTTKHAESMYITTVSGRSGNSPIIIGFLEYLKRHEPSIGYFTPIATDPLKSGVPKNIAVIKQTFNLIDDPKAMFALSDQEAEDLLVAGKGDELMERVWSAYTSYKQGKEFVVIDGRTIEGVAGIELNARIAAELDSPILMVASMWEEQDLSASELANRTLIASNEIMEQRADVLGVLVNDAPRGQLALLGSQLKRKLDGFNIAFAGVIPFDDVLSARRLNEISAGLGLRLVYGDPDDLDIEVRDVAICSEDVPNFLERLDKMNHERQQHGLQPTRPLVLTSKDRADAALGLVAAHQSGVSPHIAGLVLTDAATSTELPNSTDKILSKIALGSGHILPVLEADETLYDVMQGISHIHPGILPESTAKIHRAQKLFAEYVDADAVVKQLLRPKAFKLTPTSFIHRIYDICKADLQHIVLPEAMDKRILCAASEVVARGLARVTLLGSPQEVLNQAKKFNIDISGCSILDYLNSPLMASYVEAYAEARKEKGVTTKLAYDSLTDMNAFGTMMVKAGDADGMVSGATCTTANTIRPGLQLLRTINPALNGKSLVSSIFFMCLPDKVLTYGDCAVNVEPTAEELAAIAISSADTTAAFGITPRIAMLSYSTLGSGAGPQVDKVAAATAIVRELRPDLLVEGPIQYDAAIDPDIARQKVKGDSEVAGRATVCIFPDLNTGNNTYKAVQQSTGAIAIGPLMQGLSKPVNDLSRGCTMADVVNTVACTAVQSIGGKRATRAAEMNGQAASAA